MPDYIFQNLWKRGVKAGVQTMKPSDAIKWFRQAATAVATADPKKMIGSAGNFELVNRMSPNSIGRLYLFSYKAKYAATLPYYDKWPMIFPIEMYPDKGSFLGCNMHYLPPYARSKLMDELYKTISNTRFDKTTKLRISYGILKGFSHYFKPTIHKSLVSHLQSQFLYIKPELWDMGVLLPTARFTKANQTRVWSESMTKL